MTEFLEYYLITKMNKIIIIDDDPISLIAGKSILSNKFEVVALNITDGVQSAIEKIIAFSPDIILLDIVMPNTDGFSFFGLLEKNIETKDIPVIFLTSKTEIEDKTIGFSLGAYDYITKPFDPRELILRIDANIAKSKRKSSKTNLLEIGPFSINSDKYEITVHEKNGTNNLLDLTQTEFKLLVIFIKNMDKVFTRDDILNALFYGAKYITDRSIDVHISSLRKKSNLLRKCIKTVYGSGYKFNLE